MEMEIVVGLIGAILGCITGAVTIHFGRKQLFADVVSRSRVEWIRKLPENIGIMLAEARTVIFPKSDKPFSRQYGKKYYRARTEILTQINLHKEKHEILKVMIHELDGQVKPGNKNEKAFDVLCETIIEVVRQIEKEEWEAVKSEAKGIKKL
jgi:hypothetical protein